MLAKIKMPRFYEELDQLAKQHPGVYQKSEYGKAGEHPLLRIDSLKAEKPVGRILLTAGVHGNEHLGSLALLEFLHQFAKDPQLHEKFEIVAFPNLNPRAMEMGERRVPKDFDMNREIHPKSIWPESQLFQANIRNEKFDLALDLHGGPTRTQFFVIREAEDQGLARKALSIFPESLKLSSNSGSYPGRSGTQSKPMKYLVPAPGIVESSHAGTVKSYLQGNGIATRAYTLEYPLRLPAQETNENYARLIRSFFKEF
jgi:predicted deacylase